MITKAVKDKRNNYNAECCGLSPEVDMDQLGLEEFASSDGQVEMRSYIHIYDYQVQLGILKTTSG